MTFEFSNKVKDLKPSAIREIFKSLTDPSVITFAAGNEHAQGKTPNLDLVELTIPEGWIKGNDGWYYLEAPLTSNTPVFALTSVKFDVAMGNEYQGATATVDIVAQAVQTANNGDSALTAKGWPASETGVASGVTG